MLANYLIGLREGLEGALVVGILIAYLVRTGRRDALPAAWAGVGVAVLIALGAGAALTFGPRGLSFRAQELIGGVLSIASVALITWMIFWMARTARHLRAHLEGQLSTAVATGAGSVFVICLLAVGREGLETALFLWTGAQATGNGTGSAPLLGAAAGLATAIVLGHLIYRGALKVNLRLFFAWTGTFLILVAAGVLAYGIHDLQEAGVLPGLENLAFDVSGSIPPSSWYGTLLTGAFSFSAQTTVLQAVAWVGYAVPTLILFLRTVQIRPARATAAPAAQTVSA